MRPRAIGWLSVAATINILSGTGWNNLLKDLLLLRPSLLSCSSLRLVPS